MRNVNGLAEHDRDADTPLAQRESEDQTIPSHRPCARPHKTPEMQSFLGASATPLQMPCGADSRSQCDARMRWGAHTSSAEKYSIGRSRSSMIGDPLRRAQCLACQPMFARATLTCCAPMQDELDGGGCGLRFRVAPTPLDASPLCSANTFA